MIAPVRRAGHRATPYTLSAEALSAGSTLGSPKAVAVVKATGALEKLYSPEAGKDVFDTLLVRHWDAQSGIALRRRSGRVVIAPEREEHQIEFTEGIAARERIFVLHTAPRGRDDGEADLPAAYYEVELRNEGDRTVHVASYAALSLRGGFEKGTQADFDRGLAGFVVRSKDEPKIVRIVASSVAPASYEVTTDIAKAAATNFPGALSNETIGATRNPIAVFHIENRLEPGESSRFYFILTFSVEGEVPARQTLAALPECAEALKQTQEYYEATLGHTVVMTPEAQINRGVLWAKANMLRCLLRTNQGWCFVNDPTETTKSVARDTCWFGFGADYVVPWFAHDSLLWFADHLTDPGMAVEWYDNRTGETETYGLDINDNTALLILALRHHFCATGDRSFLASVYPKILRAGRYIVSKRADRGLVWCHAPGTGSHGIVGWRNVIQGYRLGGATTELNSECYAALRAVSLLAEELEDSRAARDFARHARDLRTAINAHLLDPDRRLYYLAIDEDGRARTDVTSDLVFPILFGVAEDNVAINIVATLSRPEFCSDAGLHTVPRDAMNYGPVDGSGLFGGIWGGPTFWFASAAARYDPHLTANALASAFKHYAEDPIRYNTVPGQFCEWLHGEALTNQGMMLSPWFAPKYLWATLEGVAGLSLDSKEPAVKARLPAQWHWIGVRNVPLRETSASWFTVRMDELVTYATAPIASVAPQRRYQNDVSDDVRVSGDGVASIALQRRDALVILLGSTVDCTTPTAVAIEGLELPYPLHVRSYTSLSREWTTHDDVDARRLRDGFALELERGGFCLLELTKRE